VLWVEGDDEELKWQGGPWLCSENNNQLVSVRERSGEVRGGEGRLCLGEGAGNEGCLCVGCRVEGKRRRRERC